MIMIFRWYTRAQPQIHPPSISKIALNKPLTDTYGIHFYFLFILSLPPSGLYAPAHTYKLIQSIQLTNFFVETSKNPKTSTIK